MVRGRDAAIVLGLVMAAAVAVLLLTNLLRLGDDLGATMTHPLARQTAGSSWLMPPGLTQRPAGTAAAAGSLGSPLTRVAGAQARRTPSAGTALTPAAAVPEPSPLVAAPGAALRRLVALPRASTPRPPPPGPRRVTPQAPGRVTPRPATAPPPASPAVATVAEPPPVVVAAPQAPQSPTAPAPPAQARPADDEGDDAVDGDRGKGRGKGKASHDPGDDGRSNKHTARAAGQGLEPR